MGRLYHDFQEEIAMPTIEILLGQSRSVIERYSMQIVVCIHS